MLVHKLLIQIYVGTEKVGPIKIGCKNYCSIFGLKPITYWSNRKYWFTNCWSKKCCHKKSSGKTLSENFGVNKFSGKKQVKCYQNKCLLGKLHLDNCAGSKAVPPLKFVHNYVSHSWGTSDIEFVWMGGGVQSRFLANPNFWKVCKGWVENEVGGFGQELWVIF